MTLYEFNLLNYDEKLISVYDKGIFSGNHISDSETLNCYSIDMFFVEVVYNGNLNKIIKVISFKSGHSLDKYSSDLNKYFK